MFRKGQAALEFLMTYGWAILVVLIAIGALAYFGVLNPENMLPEKCTIATGSGIFCDDFNVSSNSATLRLQNIMNKQITITDIAMTDCTSYSGSTAIASDATADISLVCSFSDNKAKSDMNITYSRTGGLTKIATGQLVAAAP